MQGAQRRPSFSSSFVELERRAAGNKEEGLHTNKIVTNTVSFFFSS